jgi:hypothetical protein
VVNGSLTILEGSSISLQCSTQGNPTPTLTWLKGGELVGSITAAEVSVLELLKLNPQGDGQYRCLAENEHGRASSSLNITVECEWDITSCGIITYHIVLYHLHYTMLHHAIPLYMSVISLPPPSLQTPQSFWTSPSAQW